MSNNTPHLLDNATYALTADTGELANQAFLLAKSIRRHCKNANIVIFIPRKGYEQLDESYIDTLKEYGTIVVDELETDKYPIIAMVQALDSAVKEYDSEYYIGLDTDTVFINTPSIPHTNADIYLTPRFVGAGYWTSKQSNEEWIKLYDRYNKTQPSYTVTSLADKKETRPYFNAGVVITSDKSLPSEWLSITKDIVVNKPFNKDEQFFNDQIALALTVADKNVHIMDKTNNYPLEQSLFVPNDVKIIHYSKSKNLSRIRNNKVKQELLEIGWTKQNLSFTDWCSMAGAIVSGNIGRVVNYNQRELLRSNVKKVIRTIQ